MAGPATEIKPAYLIAGTDEGKIDATLARLRARAEREGGPGSLQSFSPADGQGPPDAESLVAAMPSMSLMAERRYLLADGVERWTPRQTEPVIAAIAALPPDVSVVLVARERPPRLKAPKGLAEAVKAAGGAVHTYASPKARELPARLVADARGRGFRLDPAAARLLVERMGESTLRLATELERLAVWAGPGGEVTVGDLEAMVADTSEEVAWALSDAIVARDRGAALRAAERLASQGEALTSLVYQAAKRLREANLAISALEAGRPAKEIEANLPMHPYAAKMLLRRVRGASADELRGAACAIADLEWWSRGGSDYPDDLALTLAVRRATGDGV
jgi:DNA polymerase-3 subunit delta